MNKKLTQALTNIKIVTGNARMTREEHNQLAMDITLIENELQEMANKKETKEKVSN